MARTMRAGQEILDVGHVGVDFDDGERGVGGKARRGWRVGCRREQLGERAFERGGGELVGVVLDQARRADWRRRGPCARIAGGMLSTPLMRPSRRSRMAVGLVGVGDGFEGSRVGGDGLEHFLQSDGAACRGPGRPRPTSRFLILPPKA